MKEIIVFKTESSIKGRKEISKINEYVNNFNFDCEFKRKIEQVPESWEELKELCKDLKGLYKNYNIEVFDDAIFVLDAKAVLLKVYDDGEIKDSGSEVIAENRTPQQMWQIIKSLIGEE